MEMVIYLLELEQVEMVRDLLKLEQVEMVGIC